MIKQFFSLYPKWAKSLLIFGIVALIFLCILFLIEFIAYVQGFIRSRFLFSPTDHAAASAAIAALISGVITIFAVTAAFIAGSYAKRQLDISEKTAYGDFLLHLDKMFLCHQRIHINLHPRGDWSDGARCPQSVRDRVALEVYMGLFERIQVLIEKDIIKLDVVNRLYGYRLFNIVHHKAIRTDILEKEADGWRDFITLWYALSQLEGNENQPKPSEDVLCRLNKV